MIGALPVIHIQLSHSSIHFNSRSSLYPLVRFTKKGVFDLGAGSVESPRKLSMQQGGRMKFRPNASTLYKIDEVHANPHTTSTGTSTFYIARRVQDNHPVIANTLFIGDDHPLHELLGAQERYHSSIVQFIDHCEEDLYTKWLVFEYSRGDWLNNVVARNSFQEDHIACIVARVCAGLEFLHDLGFILRTVKTEGIFLTRSGEVKICDLQNVIKLESGLKKHVSSTELISPHWMPPEVARKQHYTVQTDTWSLGIMIIELLEKVPPYFQEVPREVLRILAANVQPVLDAPASEDLRNFLDQCLVLEQQKRPSTARLSKHKFLSSACPSSDLIPLLRHKFRPISLDNEGPRDVTGRVTRSSAFAEAHGGFSDVWLGTYDISEYSQDEKSVIPVAIKVLRSLTPDPGTHRKIQKRLNRELSVWSMLRHPNVVELYGICTDMSPYSSMVSPWYHKGSAPQFLKSLGEDATLYVRLRLLTDVANGLEYLHRFTPTVVHGDLKGANVLISDDDSACLCDFGLSTIVGEVAGSSNFTSTFAASMRWTAPELIQDGNVPEDQTPQVTTWSDIYALGSVTYELLTGLVPYHTKKNDVHVMFELIQGGKPARPSATESAVPISDQHWEFIQCCWQDNPLDRPAISVASPHLERMYCEAQPPWHISVTRRRETLGETEWVAI